MWEGQELQVRALLPHKSLAGRSHDYRRSHSHPASSTETPQTALLALQEEVDGIEARLPALEAAKREAAQAKQYKEAGARMREIKVRPRSCMCACADRKCCVSSKMRPLHH
jgi:hypothetical protein